MQDVNESTNERNSHFNHLLAKIEFHANLLTLAIHNFHCWAYNLLQIFIQYHSDKRFG